MPCVIVRGSLAFQHISKCKTNKEALINVLSFQYLERCSHPVSNVN